MKEKKQKSALEIAYKQVQECKEFEYMEEEEKKELVARIAAHIIIARGIEEGL